MEKNNYDILIAGAGFAGSLTALILNNCGLKVCLVEKDKHPRFAIGESSTPVADMILRSLSEKYNLPWLYDFSRYGSWQKAHPEIVCGIKRGFSFFKHFPGKTFYTDPDHSNELLVAASSSDALSDTNWLRADVDAFLVHQVKEAGIDYWDGAAIVGITENESWEFQLAHLNEKKILQSKFFIDATGSGNLLQNFLNVTAATGDLLTNSLAIFSHFNHVPKWMDLLHASGIATHDYPYHPDLSALHQVLHEGWIWMLRFNDDRTSMGFVLDNKNDRYDAVSTEKIWNGLFQKYPSVQQIFDGTQLAAQPGKIIRSKRLQRKLKTCCGSRWVALPHTAGFIDPLFSSGIALTLSGMEKIVGAITQYWKDEQLLHEHLKKYERAFFEELQLTDYLIAGSYHTMPHFELFNAWSMLYFAATIAHEKRRLNNEPPGYFLNADDVAIQNMVHQSFADLLQIIARPSVSENDISRFTKIIKDRIAPYNTAGLLDPSLKNMYQHTAAGIL